MPIIEDDYDYDFHYDNRPILPLASSDHRLPYLYMVKLVAACTSFEETNVHTFNNGVVYTEKEMRGFIDTVERRIPTTYQIKPIVYHKVIGKDTVVNYLAFSQVSLNGLPRKPAKVEFQQDSLFLLLNKRLPDFTLTDLNGHTVSSAFLKGKPALINFWNTRCGPCIAEMSQLSKLKDKYGDRMNFLSITGDSAKEMAAAGRVEVRLLCAIQKREQHDIRYRFKILSV